MNGTGEDNVPSSEQHNISGSEWQTIQIRKGVKEDKCVNVNENEKTQ